MRLLCVIVATLLAGMIAAPISGADAGMSGLGIDNIIASSSFDLDGDGTAETIVITSEKIEAGHHLGGEIILLKEIDGKIQQVWKRGGLNPWKLEIGDVDGDGIKDIAVGVWTKSPFDPVMAKRVFVFSWDGTTVHKKWLGSRLCRRFDDFVLCDINSDGWAELVALEIADRGRNRVAVYRWSGFGFEWLGCSDEVQGIDELKVEDGIPYAAAKSNLLKISISEDKVNLEPVKEERQQ